MFNKGVKMTRQEKRRHVDAWMKSGVDRDEYAAQHEISMRVRSADGLQITRISVERLVL